MALPRELITRQDDRHGSELGDVIRQLTSDSQGVAFAALRAMARKLEKYNCSFLDLADHIENGGGGLSEADKQKISAAIESARIEGYAEGVKAAESKQHGTGAFRNTDGTLDWREVALFIQRKKHKISKLTDWDNEFIDDMASRTARPNYEPSVKQHQQLHRIFYKLGGKIT
jgi:hypothetical protein